MTLTSNNQFSFLTAAIEAEIKSQAKVVADKAIKKAIENITEEVGKSVDSIALKLVKEYSVQDMGTHILIHVKKSI